MYEYSKLGVADLMNDPLGNDSLNFREREILDEIQHMGGTARVNFLAERLGVSEETIRRNLKTLVASGKVRKVHGGVHLTSDLTEPPFHRRMKQHAEAKRGIASTLAGLIKDGESIFLDIGSTTAYVAKALQNHSNLLIVTNSVYVAQTLATRNNNRIFLAGGELRSHDGAAFGREAIEFVRNFNVETAVFSVAAINSIAGFMLQDLAEAELAAVAAKRAFRRIVAATSAKFGQTAPINWIGERTPDLLVTDRRPPTELSEYFANNGVEVVLPRTD